MPSSVTILGPINKRDPDRNRAKSAPQVLDLPQFDSRLGHTQPTPTLTYRKIRSIRRDPTIRLAKMAVVAPMVHTPWQYKSSDKAPEGSVNLIKECLEPFRNWFIQNAIYGALDFGWQPFEIVYKYDTTDGYIKIACFKQLLHDFTTILAYEDTGMFAGFTNEPVLIGTYANNVIIPLKYALNITLEVEGSDWYGESVYASLESTHDNYKDVNSAANRYDKKIAGATWVVHYPIGDTPLNGEMTDNADIAHAILERLESSGAIAIPDEIQEFLTDKVEKDMKGKWRVELISATNSSAVSFIDRLKYLDALKMRAFGLPERSILEGQHGTKAEADSHGDIALGTIDTKHRLLCDQLRDQVISKVMTINFGAQYASAVWIEPSPVVDTRFSTIKRVYELLLQNPETLLREAEGIDFNQLRKELEVPSRQDISFERIEEDEEAEEVEQ